MSQPTQQQDGAKEQEKTNLDLLIVSVRHPKDPVTMKDYPLNMFISKEGRRSASRKPEHFDYKSFRLRLSDELGIAIDAKLYVTTMKERPFSTEAEFHGFLLAAQNGKSPGHPGPRVKLPYHEITTVVPEDDGEIQQSLQGVKDPFMNRSNSDGSKDWPEVCKFFNCSESDDQIEVLGLKLSLFPYQAWTVWRVFSQIAERRVPSFIIGDAPGLGKTGMSLTIAVIFAMLKKTQQDIERERRAGRNANHLPGTQQANAQCPSHVAKRIQCPCVPNSLSGKIVKEMLDFPTLICVPPHLLGQWYTEAKTWFDVGPDSPAKIMRAFIRHADVRRDQQQLTPNVAQSIMGELVLPCTTLDYKINAQVGSSRNIIIFSNSGTAGLVSLFKRFGPPVTNPQSQPRRGRGAPRMQPLLWNSLACSLVFFDEYHKYYGTAGTTQSFKLLQEMRERVNGKILAVGLSANIKQGPALYAPFVNHYRNSSPTHTDMSLATRLELQRMAIYSTDFKYLSTHNRDVLTNRQQKEYDTRHARLTGFLDDFNPEMTVARDPSSLFRGKRIGGPLGLIHIKACPMTEGNTYDAIRQLSVRVAQNITQLYQDRLEYLTERGRENEMPTKKDFTDNMIHTMAQYPARPNQDKAWRTLSRSCSFPLVGLLTRDQTIDSDKLLTEAIKDVATPITDRLHPDRRDRLQINEINDHLRKSPFYPYRAQLEQESPKINFIEELINRLLVTKDRPVGDEQVKERHGDPPADGTNNHHLLVFSEMAISAFLCFMILWTRFEAEIRDKKIFILYVHSGVPAAVRHVYKGYLQEDCQPGDPIKILISTSNLFGEGYNLQRVNTCVLTEIPSTYEIQRQCFGRVDRTGQSMRTWLYQLYDERNPTEKIRYRRNKNKRELAMREAQGDDVQEQPEEDLIDELDPNRRA